MPDVPVSDVAGADSASRRRYLELLKGCLTRDIFPEEEILDVTWWAENDVLASPEAVWAFLHEHGWRLVRRPEPGPRDGLSYPAHAETMVGRARLDNVEEVVTTVVREGVPGDLVETGVWRGGTVIFMRAMLEVLGDEHRQVWVCDSFQGLPEPDVERYPADESMRIDDPLAAQMFRDLLGVSVEQVKAGFERYGLLDDRVRFVEGWFSDTLPTAPIGDIAVLRLDGDLYESTLDALTSLEPKVSAGGFVIVDDYGSIDACRKAVEDYRAERGITDPVETIDWTGAYWRVSR